MKAWILARLRERSTWAGLVGPAALPAATRAVIAAATLRAMETAAYLDRQRELGADVATPAERGPEALLAFWRAELDRTRATATRARITAE